MGQLIGPSGIVQAGSTSKVFTTPFPHAVGAKSRDAEGNEYVFCDFTGTVYYGCLVQITSTYLASPLLGTANIAYRVGVVMAGDCTSSGANNPTSDNAGWVQIFGIHPAVQTGTGSDEGVSETAGGNYWCLPQASVGTPSGTLTVIAQGAGTSTKLSSVDGNKIHGMWVVDLGEVSSLTTWPGSSGASGPTSVLGDGLTSGTNTSAFIGQTYAVYMNYPYVTGITMPLGNATT